MFNNVGIPQHYSVSLKVYKHTIHKENKIGNNFNTLMQYQFLHIDVSITVYKCLRSLYISLTMK